MRKIIDFIKERYQEYPILIASVIKWFLLSSIVGILVGISVGYFLKFLELSINILHFKYYFLLAPAGFFLSTIIIKYFAPNAKGHGTEKVIEAIHKRSGRINPAVIPVKAVSTIITVITGGSVGKEGPSAQIGGGIASLLSDIFKLNNVDRRKLVVCGISAGFASVFGTPIAGAVFGVEVLFIGKVFYDVLFPSFVAGIISFEVTSKLGLTYFNYGVNIPLHFSSIIFVQSAGAGIFFGIVSLTLIEILSIGRILNKKLHITEPLKAIIGGIVIIILAFLLSGKYTGLGMDIIQKALAGEKIPLLSGIWKAIFTSVTLNFGGSGGILTPVFFVGSTTGNVFGRLFHLNPTFFAAIGMISVLSGSANAPISAGIMAIELFGPAIGPYAAISAVISYIITGHRSVYPSQILGFSKSSSVDVEEGIEIVNAKPKGKIKKWR